MSFPDSSDGKESACNAEDLSFIPGLGRSPEEGNGYPLQYSCLENSMDRGPQSAIVHGVSKSQTQLSHTHTHTHTQLAYKDIYLIINLGKKSEYLLLCKGNLQKQIKCDSNTVYLNY